MNPAATANVAGDTLLATSGDIVVENGTLNAGNGGTGSRIWGENNEEGGASFYVELPVEEDRRG